MGGCNYRLAEWPLGAAVAAGIAGFGLEHAALASGGLFLWGLFFVLLAAIIGVAFRIAHHAEVLALRLGEPYGTLILTLATVAVEVVILAVMLSASHSATLARDAVYSAIMLDINGILGIAAIIGGLKHGSGKYNLSSANSYIAMPLVALGIGMFVPDFVPDSAWPAYSIFTVVVMGLLYIAFLRLQTMEHRQFFEYDSVQEEAQDAATSPNWLHASSWSPP